MKIKAGDLHFSRPILEKFDHLREELLKLFALEKFCHKNKGELGNFKENLDELEALKSVYSYHKKRQDSERDLRHQ